MGKLNNKIAVVTGAAMGNGEGIARTFAKYGAHVVLLDMSERVFEVKQQLESQGYAATAYQVDVTNFTEIKQCIDQAIQDFGKIDVLVNNAGVIRLASFLDMSDDTRDFQFDVNIKGVWNVTKAVLPNMVENKYGKIVNMSSVTGTMVADEGETAYATTKAAILGFTKALAREVARYNITVNAICPGYILTPMAEQIAKESNATNPNAVVDGIASGVPLGRLGRIEEVGELAAFLASDESSYITGTHVVIDGGSTLPETVSVGVTS
ncbi:MULTISPECIES: SDR family oxidoreductase UcpA [Aneurinibacillus]|uniref:SDR family oxidoreductase UcpA n=1 Tax=Aneurinibacillus thermoaerophilus TaxID=143495 RepID=A0A1G8BGH9_ANETH|nr:MULTISPECIES: SDR family oxidoreductase UcpA [Aneurinibacillus]AMA71442.1 NAD(P)-dependent oxidoreductase [Aneurinibacillus sp. XH2]MED0677378.1 SDR family oxidoreductase UcpA [Aneurinibacillus thermoaerophilus]MED0680653.1 SDR family oxidoreductase UcpA [Aneurinibacillus thermoaerophilus]MED0738784.1 SDR family oxidoreductase UcpA [Aneurinibacillus thermoaerophilus]MED0755846.1 SDR family oxidoreductase UcpA [Aneurinibacillus thermoaerophilus]